MTPSNAVTVAGYYFDVGIIPQVYTVYLWAMDGAGNISVNAGATGTDAVTVTYTPIAPPVVSTVVVGNSDTMNGAVAERTIPGGGDVYVRWTASGTNLGATPVQLFFTSDDVTWTAFSGNLANGQNNCASVAGSGTASTLATGCYKWATGSPSSSYYRIRVSVTNTFNATSYFNSHPINTALLQILAGNTSSGIGGSAASGILLSNYGQGLADIQSLAVSSNGTIYFRDVQNGILSVDPKTGTLSQLIASGGLTSGIGDGGPVSAARLRSPVAMVMDYQGRLLVFDYDRIRRIDLTQVPPTINTFIGGGASTALTVASPLLLSISPATLGNSYQYSDYEMRPLPNGDLYFYSFGNYYLDVVKPVRVYQAASNTIFTVSPHGPVNEGSYTIADVANCAQTTFQMQFDPVSSAITSFFISGFAGAVFCGSQSAATGNLDMAYFLSPTTGLASVPPIPAAPIDGDIYEVAIDAHDGNIYSISRNGGYISKYDATGNSWTVLAGTGSAGSCVDGTSALSCNIDSATGYVDAGGQVYFSDRGRIRAIVGGKVITLYGQSVAYGDGGLATNARFGLVPAALERSDRSIVAFDRLSGRFRSAARSGTIQTIAGNDVTTGYPSVASPANAQPIRVYDQKFFLDSSDSVYYNQQYQIYRLPSAANSKWTKFTSPTGPAQASSAASNGANISNLFFPLYSVLLGWNGSSILFQSADSLSVSTTSAVMSEVNVATGLVTIDLGPKSYQIQSPALCADGTSYGSCYVQPGYFNDTSTPASAASSWDSILGKWLTLDLDGRSVRTFYNGGANMATATTLANPASSILFYTSGGIRYIYYCNSADGGLYLRNMDLGVEKALPRPVASVSCTGLTLSYDAVNSSIVFPFLQTGLYGIAELLQADPADNGM